MPALLRGKTTKRNSDSYCLHCFHSFAAENKLESHKKVGDFCNVVMPSEGTKISEQ